MWAPRAVEPRCVQMPGVQSKRRDEGTNALQCLCPRLLSVTCSSALSSHLRPMLPLCSEQVVPAGCLFPTTLLLYYVHWTWNKPATSPPSSLTSLNSSHCVFKRQIKHCPLHKGLVNYSQRCFSSVFFSFVQISNIRINLFPYPCPSSPLEVRIRLPSMGLHRVGHDWSSSSSTPSTLLNEWVGPGSPSQCPRGQNLHVTLCAGCRFSHMLADPMHSSTSATLVRIPSPHIPIYQMGFLCAFIEIWLFLDIADLQQVSRRKHLSQKH